MVYNIIAEKEELNLIPKDNHNPTIITGVGAINVMRALSALPKDTHLINFGYVGSPDVPVGTVTIIVNSSLHHPGVSYPEESFRLMTAYDESIGLEFNDYINNIKFADCRTACDFIEPSTSDSSRPCVYDMELAFIMGMGFTNVHSVKTVSDNVNYEQYKKNIHGKN